MGSQTTKIMTEPPVKRVVLPDGTVLRRRRVDRRDALDTRTGGVADGVTPTAQRWLMRAHRRAVRRREMARASRRRNRGA